MTDITTAAAAFLILAGATAPAMVPRPITPICTPPLHCESGWDHDCKAWADNQNHLMVRWVGDHPGPVRHDQLPGHEKGRPGEHHRPRPPHLDHHPRHHHGYRGLWE